MTCQACDLNILCQRLGILDDMPKTYHEQILQLPLSHKVITVKKGETVYQPGNSFKDIYSLRAGSIKSLSPEGQILQFHYQGDLFGIDGIEDNKYALNSIALEDSFICAFSFIDILSQLKKEDYWALTKIMSRKYRESLLHLDFHDSAQKRLIHFLMNFSDKKQKYGFSKFKFTLPMKRGDLANYLNLKIETLSRLLHDLIEEKIILVNNKEVTILDYQALQNLI